MQHEESNDELYVLVQENVEFQTGYGSAFANRVQSEKYDGDIYLVHAVHGAHGKKYQCREVVRAPIDTPDYVVKEAMGTVITDVIKRGGSA